MSAPPPPVSPAPAPPRRLGYVAGLDGVRAAAVLSVLAVHLKWVVSGNGVTVFFALSGFLITALLLEEADANGRVRVGKFFARRAVRLFPALAVFLLADLVYVTVCYAGWDRKALYMMTAAALVYLNNWVLAFRLVPDNHLSHTWSLAVEEQFYIVWPVTLMLMLKLGRTRPGAAVVALLLAAAFCAERFAVAAWATYPTEIQLEYRVYNGTDTRLDALLIGAAAAFAFRYRLLPDGRWVGAAGLIAGLLVFAHLFADLGAVPRSLTAWCLASYSLVAILTAALAYALAVGRRELGPLAAALSYPPVRYLGRLSYSLYLWHYLAFDVVERQLPGLTGPAVVAVKLAGSVALAAASYHGVEAPFLRLKKRFAAAAGPVAAAESVPGRAFAPAPQEV